MKNILLISKYNLIYSFSEIIIKYENYKQNYSLKIYGTPN